MESMQREVPKRLRSTFFPHNFLAQATWRSENPKVPVFFDFSLGGFMVTKIPSAKT